ncbi:MAG: GumC family protein, partial [Myxococcaceae bacterium]
MTNETQPAIAEPTTIDPMYYLRLFLRRRWVILGFLAVVVASVAFYTLRQPKVFQASTSLIIDTAAPKVLDKQMGEVMDEGTGGYWYNKEYYQTQYKVIVSRAVSQRVVDKLGLQSDATFLGLDKVTDETKRAELFAKLDAPSLLQGKINVVPAKDSRVVSIAVEDLDAQRAALLANEVAEAYIAENLALKLRITESASRWLEERLTSLEDKSKKSELAIYDFKKSSDMLTTSLEDRQSMLSQRLNALNAALTEVKLKIAGLKARVEAIRGVQQAAKDAGSRWAEGLPSATENLLIQQFKVRLATQQSECAELMGRGYLGEHPKFISCQEKLKGAEQDLLRELNNIIVASETDLREATGKDKNLTALFDAAKAEAFEV